MTIADLARDLGCDPQQVPEPLTTISRLVDLAHANEEVVGSEAVVVVANASLVVAAKSLRAGLWVIDSSLSGDFQGFPRLEVPHGYGAFARLSQLLVPLTQPETDVGIDPLAKISPKAVVHPTASVGAFSVVGSGTVVGAGVVIAPNVVIGRDCVIKDGATLFSGVVLYDKVSVGERTRIHGGAVIGGDGFGYAPSAKGPSKIHHSGGVIIGADAEIGSNTTIDQGTLHPTKIGNLVKIDNLVQVGHNCEIGDASVVCGMAGLPGGVKLGRGVTVGGMAGFNNRVVVGDFSQVGGMTGVSKDLPPNSKVIGRPMKTLQEFYRLQVLISRLPALFKKVEVMAKKMGISSGEGT